MKLACTTLSGAGFHLRFMPAKGQGRMTRLIRLFMVGIGMQCRHVRVRDHGNDQHSICY